MIELIGWAGAACILGAYLWVTYNKPSTMYHAVNLVGCLLLLVNVWYHRAWPSVAINLTWAAIAIMGFIKEREDQTDILELNAMDYKDWMDRNRIH